MVMIMNILSFKKHLALVFLFIAFPVFSQHKSLKQEGRYTTFFKNLVPDYAKIHYAGSMGMFSFGPGWSYFRKIWETDLLFGFDPISDDRPSLYILTLKQNYLPWKISCNRTISFEPLAVGGYVTMLLNDKDLWFKQPDRYPKGYYWHSNRVRFNVFLGERLTFNLHKEKSFVQSVTAFYEFSTCDLYAIKIFKEKYLKPRDYLGLSFGIKLHFK